MMRDKIESALKNPVSWAAGGVASVAAVLASLLSDPTGGVASIIAVAVEQAGNIFTAASIAGFTVAPAFEWMPTGAVQNIAIVFGVILVLSIVSRLWDELKRRFR